jgi:heme exporter protein CcmD
MSYLIPAYAFATLVLGGYLVWSLRRLRELTRERAKRGDSDRL